MVNLGYLSYTEYKIFLKISITSSTRPKHYERPLLCPLCIWVVEAALDFELFPGTWGLRGDSFVWRTVSRCSSAFAEAGLGCCLCPDLTLDPLVWLACSCSRGEKQMSGAALQSSSKEMIICLFILFHVLTVLNVYILYKVYLYIFYSILYIYIYI